MGDLHLLTGFDKGVRINNESMILGGDLNFSGSKILYGMVSAMVSELQFVGGAAKGQTEYLVAKTDPEDRHLAQKFLHAGHSVFDRFRVTRTVGQENTVRLKLKNPFR